MMLQVIKPQGNDPIYNCMLSIKSGNGEINFSRAMGLNNASGEPTSVNHRFRTGSITKLFTATIILQLLEDGLISMEDSYFDLIHKATARILSGLHIYKETDCSKKISLKHLLQHSSGIGDYYSDEERFFNYVMQHPFQSWNWELVMEKYFEFSLNRYPAFAPGTGFHYSDTNYLLLAVLIEQITGKPLHQVYRERILTPLKLADTYLEFYESPEKTKPVVYPYYGLHSLENINTSFDWGAGGLISTMDDLEIFMTSLFTENILLTNRETSLQQLGLGMQIREQSFLGHRSAYGSMLFYNPLKDICIVLSLNQAKAVIRSEWLLKKLILEIEENKIPSSI